jgi:hypothetical protein
MRVYFFDIRNEMGDLTKARDMDENTDGKLNTMDDMKQWCFFRGYVPPQEMEIDSDQQCIKVLLSPMPIAYVPTEEVPFPPALQFSNEDGTFRIVYE